jgi:aspartate/methionine/tyrosine aminotransferase
MGTLTQVDQSKQEELLLKSKIHQIKSLNFRFSNPEYPFTENEVVLTHGCSGAIYSAISVLCSSGDNILVPRPGFPLALPITENIGVELRYYDLLVNLIFNNNRTA